ncbi:hypothetical protein DRQ36_04255 [bacterium]|nr:MAG: hypothetical protein DRQ36_04255 [bacterium]
MKRNNYLIITLALCISLLFAQEQIPENVVAKVNEVEITVEELTDQNNEMVSQIERFYSKTAGSSRVVRRIGSRNAEDLLERAINKTLILEEAEKANMAQDPDVLAATEAFKNSMMIEMYFQKVLIEEARPSIEEVKEEYEKSNRFYEPERAKIISIKAENAEIAEQKAAELRAIDIENLGEGRYNIEIVRVPKSKENVQGSSASNANRDERKGSKLRGRSQTGYSMLADAEPGDVIGPIEQGNRYIVMLVLEKIPEGKKPFEEVKEELTRSITERNLAGLRRKKEEELRKNATVTIYYENLNKAFAE